MLTFGPGVFDAMIAALRGCLPQEGCGFLVGRDGVAERLIPLPNQAASPREYSVDPAVLLREMRGIRESGQELVGIYHSHPAGDAYPSARDVREAYYPETVYVVVSLRDPEKPVVRAFRIIEGQVDETELHAIV